MNPINDALVVRFMLYGSSEQKLKIIHQDLSLIPRNNFKWICEETRITIQSCSNPEIRPSEKILYVRGRDPVRDNSIVPVPGTYETVILFSRAIRNLNKHLKQQQRERTEVPF